MGRGSIRLIVAALGLALGAAVLVVGSRGESSTACVTVTPEQAALQLIEVKIDGVTSDVSANLCSNTATTARGYVNDDIRYREDYVEIYTIREDDGGVASESPDCKGKRLSTDYLVVRLAPDGGTGDGG